MKRLYQRLKINLILPTLVFILLSIMMTGTSYADVACGGQICPTGLHCRQNGSIIGCDQFDLCNGACDSGVCYQETDGGPYSCRSGYTTPSDNPCNPNPCTAPNTKCTATPGGGHTCTNPAQNTGDTGTGGTGGNTTTPSRGTNAFESIGQLFSYAKNDKSPTVFLQLVYKALLPIAIILGMILIAVAGYGLMTSQGDPQKAQEAKEQLTSAIMGLLFILLGAGILRAIISTLIQGEPSGF